MGTALTRLRQRPVMRWLLDPQRIPLLFAVTIISGIFYHYAPKFTVLWIVLSLLLIGGLFRLFDYVKKHHFIGGMIYLTVGLLFLLAARLFWQLGFDAPIFGPEDYKAQITFLVWFLTPQSVLTADYPGYTIALFTLFTFFIASITYYFTLVRYRVLMSFMVMIFPFAIYAKENETMPVISIIILFVCYFAVMVYCRQAHAEDSAAVQIYEPNAESKLKMPSKHSAFVGQKPEILDRSFVRAGGIFITAATIAVLILPKPTVDADRQFIDRMMEYSKLSDLLMDAISGFAESSDGGNYAAPSYNRNLFFTEAEEPLLLRVRTFTDYHYDDNTWYAGAFDGRPDMERFPRRSTTGFSTLDTELAPDQLMAIVKKAATQDAAFAEKWGLSSLKDMNTDPIIKTLGVQVLTSGNFVLPAPQFTTRYDPVTDTAIAYQSRNGVLFRNVANIRTGFRYNVEYLSPQYLRSPAVMQLLGTITSEQWGEFLADLYIVLKETDDRTAALRAYNNYNDAMQYAADVNSQTPDSVRNLAVQLTQNCTTEAKKAGAIADYLTGGAFTYSTNYVKPADYNVETFLFRDKTGICYDFAGAYTELCRAVGIPARNVQGYAMSEQYETTWGGNADDDPQHTYVITNEHGHAWAEVYLAGAGWVSVDATAPSNEAQRGSGQKSNVTITLQYSGLILLVLLTAGVFVMLVIVPVVREKLFRSRYQKLRNAEAVQAAMQRLLKQWDADPAETARDICEKQAKFLGVDLSELLDGFERAAYGGFCDEATADRVFRNYCAAYDAYRAALKRERAAKRAERKQAKPNQT